mmetsp:Transcript_17748/g.34646  ORF Transcript_17748/g.34646 Transcript_17748/m.34646 type:complete len:252 (-) Transcript_17748:335-1090(-)
MRFVFLLAALALLAIAQQGPDPRGVWEGSWISGDNCVTRGIRISIDDKAEFFTLNFGNVVSKTPGVATDISNYPAEVLGPLTEIFPAPSSKCVVVNAKQYWFAYTVDMNANPRRMKLSSRNLANGGLITPQDCGTVATQCTPEPNKPSGDGNNLIDVYLVQAPQGTFSPPTPAPPPGSPTTALPFPTALPTPGGGNTPTPFSGGNSPTSYGVPTSRPPTTRKRQISAAASLSSVQICCLTAISVAWQLLRF